MKIALIFAMEAEASPLIQSLNLKLEPSACDPALPFRHFTGRFGTRTEIFLSVNGKDSRYGVDNVGTEPATLNAYVTLHHARPEICINAGTAGGFIKRGASIGNVYLSRDAFRFHDRRIPLPGGFEAYGRGHYPALDVSQMASALKLKQGVISTGNSLDCTATDLDLIDQNEGHAKEMESAGIAWVAHLLGVPFFAVKSITDLVDGPHPTPEEFMRNLEMASRKLREATLEVLGYLDAHGLPPAG